MKQKSILVRLLSVVCMVCLSLCLVFGLAACNDAETVKAIKSISMNANGDIVVVYTDNTTETVKANNQSAITVCGHENTYVVSSGMAASVEDMLIASALKEAEANKAEDEEIDEVAIVKQVIENLPDDKCYVSEMKACADCGDLIVSYAAHDGAAVSEAATCTLGSFSGTGCNNCDWVDGVRQNDAVGHNYATVADPIAFQAGLMGKAINPCTDEHYTSVKICQNIINDEKCGVIAIETAPKTGHIFKKEELTKNKTSDKDVAFTMSGVCVTCKTPATVVTLPKLNDEDYHIVSGGSNGYTGHLLTYTYSGEVALNDNYKFEDGTTTYTFENEVVTTATFTAPHYILKGEKEVEVYNKVINDYAEGVYSNLFIASDADPLTCDPDADGSAATAVCEFCNTSVPTTVKIAHTDPENEEDLIVSYGDDPCYVPAVYPEGHEKAGELWVDANGRNINQGVHTEIWKCDECGDYEIEVDDREHKYSLSTADDAVIFNQNNTVTLNMVCDYCGGTDTKTGTGLETIKAETCGDVGQYKYTDENGKEWTFDKPATQEHVYATGKVVEYNKKGDIEYIKYTDAKDYIGKSIYLDAAVTKVVCDSPISATLICPDCGRSKDVTVIREHVLDEEHSKPAAQTCVGDAYSVKYCSYTDCENVWKEDGTGVSYEPDGRLNARHTFKFVSYDEETKTLTVECTVCKAIEEIVEPTVENTVTDKTCEDYAKDEPEVNYNTYTFEHTIVSEDPEKVNTAEEYAVIEELPITNHKYGVFVGMEVDPASTEYDAEAIIAASNLDADSAAENCQTNAAYRFICADCNRSVAITVVGSHVNTDGEIVAATCEKGEHWTCDALKADGVTKCGAEVSTGKPALGHDEVIVVNGNTVKVTCKTEDCNLDLTFDIADATAGEAKNCEDCYYTYEYVNGSYKEVFTFEAKKVDGISHEFLKIGETAVQFCYVIVNGKAELYTGQSGTRYCGNYCTVCSAFVPVA